MAVIIEWRRRSDNALISATIGNPYHCSPNYNLYRGMSHYADYDHLKVVNTGGSAMTQPTARSSAFWFNSFGYSKWVTRWRTAAGGTTLLGTSGTGSPHWVSEVWTGLLEPTMAIGRVYNIRTQAKAYWGEDLGTAGWYHQIGGEPIP